MVASARIVFNGTTSSRGCLVDLHHDMGLDLMIIYWVWIFLNLIHLTSESNIFNVIQLING